MENKYAYYVKIALSGRENAIGGFYLFNKGEEIDLVNVLKEINLHYKSYNKEKKEIVQYTIHNIIENSKGNLNAKTLWDNLDLDIIRDINMELFDYVLKNIYFDDFMNKVNSFWDCFLVCYYYMKYAVINNLSKEDVMKYFDVYLDNHVRDNNMNYDDYIECLCETSIKSLCSAYEDKGLSVEKNIAYILHHSIGKINYKNVLRIMHEYPANTPYGVKLVKKFLNENDSMYFGMSDKVLLNLRIRNSEEAARIFNSDDYNLYGSDGRIEELINKGQYYDVTDRFEKVIETICQEQEKEGLGGFQRSDINKIIYSDKIKIISFKCINYIKRIVSNEEFNSFMLHVLDDKIIVYDEKDGVCTTVNYILNNMPKNCTKTNEISQDKLDLLERSQYIKVKE